MVRKSGIETRRWIEPGTLAAALGGRALEQALAQADLPPGALRRIIFVSSTGGDHLLPATAHDVADRLGLSETCDAFDVSNSCVGFLTALDIGCRSVATGEGPVGIVAVETFSRQLSPQGPRAFVVLGDAAAAAVLRPSPRGGLLASYLRTSDRLRGKMTMALPGTPGARPYHDFDARSRELLDSALASIGAAVNEVLARAALPLSAVDWFVLHQPNGSMYARLVEALGIDFSRTVNVVRDLGSLGCASVPTGLDRLFRTRPVESGQRILLASVGAGTAYGAALYEVP